MFVFLVTRIMKLVLLLVLRISMVWFPNKSRKTKAVGVVDENTTTTTTVGDDLSDDVVVDIICRLPPKDIARYKLVSKSWNRLISHICVPQVNSILSGFFVHTTECKLQSCPRGPWDFTSTTEIKSPPSFAQFCFGLLPFKPFPTNFLYSSNGFLLFLNQTSCQFFVCNPTTHQYITIPRPPTSLIPGRFAGLTFDDSGYYVVFIASQPLRLFVFFSVTQKWVVHTYKNLKPTIMKSAWCKNLVFLDGFFYISTLSEHILKFCFKEKNVSIRAIELPEIVTVKNYISYTGTLGVSKGRLHYSRPLREDPYHLMIWMLEETDWVLKNTLYLEDLAKKYQILGRARPFAIYKFHPTSDVVFVGHSEAIFRYHPGDNTLKCIYRVGFGKKICCGQSCLYTFSHNLAALDALCSNNKEEQSGDHHDAVRPGVL